MFELICTGDRDLLKWVAAVWAGSREHACAGRICRNQAWCDCAIWRAKLTGIAVRCIVSAHVVQAVIKMASKFEHFASYRWYF